MSACNWTTQRKQQMAPMSFVSRDACPPIDCKSYTKSDLGHQLQKMAFHRGKTQKQHSLIGTNMQDRSSTNSKTAATWCPPTEKASANQEQHRRGQAQKSIRRSRRPTPWPREGRRAQSKTRPVALHSVIHSMYTASYTACVSYTAQPTGSG